MFSCEALWLSNISKCQSFPRSAFPCTWTVRPFLLPMREIQVQQPSPKWEFRGHVMELSWVDGLKCMVSLSPITFLLLFLTSLSNTLPWQSKDACRDFPEGPCWDSVLSTQGVQAQSLVGVPGSHMPCDQNALILKEKGACSSPTAYVFTQVHWR